MGLTVRAVTFLELLLGAAALLAIFLLIVLQAGQRYLPLDGFAWTGELARFSLVWLTFVVAGVLVTRDGHVSIEVIDAVGGEGMRRLVRVVSCLVVAVIGVGLTVAAWDLTQTQGFIKSPALRMPMSWFYAISMVGFVSTVVRALVAALRYAVLGVPERNVDEVAADAAEMSVE